MLVSMVDAAEGLCPHVMKRSSLRQDLLKAGAGRMTVPRGFITTTLLEQSAVDIVNKIRSPCSVLTVKTGDKLPLVVCESSMSPVVFLCLVSSFIHFRVKQ